MIRGPMPLIDVTGVCVGEYVNRGSGVDESRHAQNGTQDMPKKKRRYSARADDDPAR